MTIVDTPINTTSTCFRSKMNYYNVANINTPNIIHNRENNTFFKCLQRTGSDCILSTLLVQQFHHKFTSSPCSRAMEAERIPRSRFKNVNADSHSEIILVTEEVSPAIVSEDPTARAAWESLRFLKFPRNCNQCRTVIQISHHDRSFRSTNISLKQSMT